MITKAYKTHQNAKDVEKQHVGWKSQQESNVSGTSAALQISHHFPSDFFFINSVKLGVKLGLSRPQLGDHLNQVHVL